MKISVALAAFGANFANPLNSNILFRKREDGLLELPQKELGESEDSLTVAKYLVCLASGIGGNWPEMVPHQVGIFDDVGRNPSEREIIIVYALFLPAKFEPKARYTWITMDSFHQRKVYLDTNAVVRYAILGRTS